ncbi:hypothetical protein LINPERPRIM_LOCUS16469 [Linum perenne]
MAKFSLLHVFVVALIFSGMILVTEADVVDVQKCVETLYPSNCTPDDCIKKCFDKHQDKRGQCVPDVNHILTSCVCIWNCGA